MKPFKYVGIITSLAISSFTSVSYAHDANNFCGFYVGASAGGSMTDVTQDQTSSFFIGLGGGATTILRGPAALKADNAPKGALFIGVGKNWNHAYLGLEAFADISNYKNRNSAEYISPASIQPQVAIISHSKLNDVQYGIDLRPGVLLNPNSMLYGRVGASFTDLKLETNYTSRLGLGVDASSNLFLSEEKGVVALRLGAGLEQNLCKSLNLRFDYIYTYYGRISAGGAMFADLSGVDTISTSDTNIKVYNNTVMLGLSYLIK